jgi:hypothetical protein
MTHFKQQLLFTLLLCASNIVSAQITKYQLDKLIYKSDFTKPLDTTIWAIEKLPADSEIVTTTNGSLLLDTYGGATVWYKLPLKGNMVISFKRTVLMRGGKNDRLSDLNVFWMATDSLQNKGFTRKGAFNEYNSLSMYYVGFGGNYNTTTRFRKYTTKGDKQILGEYKDAAHLLQANKTYTIEIIQLNGLVQFVVDGELYFSYQDKQPLTYGYFAFRSTRSRQTISDFQVHSIK